MKVVGGLRKRREPRATFGRAVTTTMPGVVMVWPTPVAAAAHSAAAAAGAAAEVVRWSAHHSVEGRRRSTVGAGADESEDSMATARLVVHGVATHLR